MDKILSLLVTNNIFYKKIGNLIFFEVSDKNKNISIYFNGKKFFIDKKDYCFQPHVIKHWNLNGDKNKYGLCLLMNGKDRRDNKLSPIGKFKRIEEIVFELWDDPVAERFRELNVLLQTKNNKNFFIDFEGNIIKNPISMQEKPSIKKIKLNFNNHNRNKLIKIKDNCVSGNEWVLFELIYKKEIKKIFVSSKNDFYKLNDFTIESFWGRTGKKKNTRKIILIGLGSIGGLVLDFLCKNGYMNIEIYDNDIMDVVNNPRHILGISSSEIGIPKKDHLANHYSKLFPMIKIKSKLKFDYKNEILNNDDLIINTTGGPISEIEMKFNELLEKNKNFTYIDIFTEPFGLGIHSIVINWNFKNKSNFFRKCKDDKRYIVTNEKDFRKNFDGCFTPTLPYGFVPLQIGIPWLMTVMVKNDFIDNHYTIPFLQLMKEKKEFLNKKLSKDINPLKIKVKPWKK